MSEFSEIQDITKRLLENVDNMSKQFDNKMALIQQIMKNNEQLKLQDAQSKEHIQQLEKTLSESQPQQSEPESTATRPEQENIIAKQQKQIEELQQKLQEQQKSYDILEKEFNLIKTQTNQEQKEVLQNQKYEEVEIYFTVTAKDLGDNSVVKIAGENQQLGNWKLPEAYKLSRLNTQDTQAIWKNQDALMVKQGTKLKFKCVIDQIGGNNQSEWEKTQGDREILVNDQYKALYLKMNFNEPQIILTLNKAL